MIEQPQLPYVEPGRGRFRSDGRLQGSVLPPTGRGGVGETGFGLPGSFAARPDRRSDPGRVEASFGRLQWPTIGRKAQDENGGKTEDHNRPPDPLIEVVIR